MVRCLRYSSGSSALQKFPAEKSVPRLEMRTLSMKPWPNGDPNISQLEPSFQLGWNWVSFGHPVGSLELAGVGSSWLKFDQAQIIAQLKPSFPPFGDLSQLSPSRFDIVRFWFCCCLFVGLGFFFFCKVFLWAGSTVLPPTGASLDFVTWLELGAPFGQGFTQSVTYSNRDQML